MERKFIIIDETGVHARPSTVLVNTAGRFKSDITLTFRSKVANLKSILEVLPLGIEYNAEIVISAEGDDAEAAIAALTDVMIDQGLSR